MAEPDVLYRVDCRAAVLTLNRPDRRNALSRGMVAALADAVRRAAGDPDVRAVILTGSGPAFCGGMDLHELREVHDAGDDPARVLADTRAVADLLDLIYGLPKPTVAAVNGPAIAGGAGLVSVCDLAVAVPTAKFGYPEVRRGLVAAIVTPQLLRLVGERAARWLLLTGEPIDAVDALRIGLVNAVTSPEGLLETAGGWARSLAEGGPNALASTKDLLRRCGTPPLSADDLARASAAPRLTPECRDGLTAFFDRRPAPWSPPGALS